MRGEVLEGPSTLTLPDGRTIQPGDLVRVKGERGVYRVHDPAGRGVWCYGGSIDPNGQRQWRCLALDRIGKRYVPPKGTSYA